MPDVRILVVTILVKHYLPRPEIRITGALSRGTRGLRQKKDSLIVNDKINDLIVLV